MLTTSLFRFQYTEPGVMSDGSRASWQVNKDVMVMADNLDRAVVVFREVIGDVAVIHQINRAGTGKGVVIDPQLTLPTGLVE